MRLDIQDSRDLNKRLEELEEKRDLIESLKEELEAAEGEEEKEGIADKLSDAETDFDKEEQEELSELENLRDEVTDWRHGATLIAESDFEDYCRDLVSEMGDLPADIPGYLVIDWAATADNLRADYSEADYQGTTYLFRA